MYSKYLTTVALNGAGDVRIGGQSVLNAKYVRANGLVILATVETALQDMARLIEI